MANSAVLTKYLLITVEITLILNMLFLRWIANKIVEKIKAWFVSSVENCRASIAQEIAEATANEIELRAPISAFDD